MFHSRYMVQRLDGTGYRAMSKASRDRMVDAGRIRMEGVDGDEGTNTVTYWYTRDMDEE